MPTMRTLLCAVGGLDEMAREQTDHTPSYDEAKKYEVTVTSY